MRTHLAAGIVLGSMVVASVARAERTTTVTLGGMFGGREDSSPGDKLPMMTAAGGPRLTLAWENPPLPLPAVPGTAVAVALVPEVTVAAIMDEQQGEALLGVGARGELQISQRDKGLFRISARMALYLAARVLVIGDRKDTGFEGAVGEYIYLGRGRTRVGGEIGVLARELTDPTSADDTQMGVFASAYVGFAL